MGKNMEAPERIWADRTGIEGAVEIGCWADTVRYMGGVEYVRADLAAPSAPAEVEGLVGPIIAVKQAFVWARDARPASYETAILKIEELLEGALPVLTAQQAEIEKQRKADEILQGLYEIEQARAEKAEGQRDAWKANAEAFAKECEAISGDCASWCSPAFADYAKLKGDV